MRVLFVTAENRHGHDFLSDNVAQSFWAMWRRQEIAEFAIWPTAPWLRLDEHPDRPDTGIPAPGARDECQIESDSAMSDVPMGLSGPADLIVGSTHAGAELAKAFQHSARVALIDGNDRADDLRGSIPHHVYFKRELPQGATWAVPIPFTYPARRIPKEPLPRKMRVVYYASDAGKTADARMRIVSELKRTLGDAADCATLDDRSVRPKPEELHHKLWTSMIGVHWNPYAAQRGEHGWWGNRFVENLAFGVACIAMRPWVEIPHPYTDGENVIWVDRPEDVAVRAAELMDDVERCLRIAKAGHAHFLKYHSAEAVARYVIQRMGLGDKLLKPEATKPEEPPGAYLGALRTCCAGQIF